MMRRLVALMLALAVVSAPVALEVCQITCESEGARHSMSHAAEAHAGHHHMPADHASCHEHGGTTQQLAPTTPPCDHGVDATPSLVAARNVDTSLSLLATVSSPDSLTLARTLDLISFHESAPPERRGLPLAIPLRV